MQSNNYATISEVSQQTGVATVTLRAWERRYGLIKPKRTSKGHRLYSKDNIAEIQLIVDWLNRGVKISKIDDLIAKQILPPIPQDISHEWQQVQDELLENLIAIKPYSLNPLLDKLNKTHPFMYLCNQVYSSLHQRLMRRWQDKAIGYQLEQQLWQQCWQRQITLMTLRAEKQKSRTSIWLINLDDEKQTLDYWLLYSLLLQSGVRIHAINQLNDLSELVSLETLHDRPVLVYGNSKLSDLNIKLFNKHRNLWGKNLFIVGAIASIHSEIFSNLEAQHSIENISGCWESKNFKTWLNLKEKE